MRLKILTLLLITSNLVIGDPCAGDQHALSVCIQYSDSLKAENSILKGTIRELDKENSSLETQLKKADSAPLIPTYIYVLGGVVVGGLLGYGLTRGGH